MKKFAFQWNISNQSSMIAYGDSIDEISEAVIESKDIRFISIFLQEYSLGSDQMRKILELIYEKGDEDGELRYEEFHIIELAIQRNILKDEFKKLLLERGNEHQIAKILKKD